ncbi:TPA: hypothetical protein L5U90_003462 [Pseudomonas aeruginosa]|nr:hypothetical protein [Pseudomonas aeruginosa]
MATDFTPLEPQCLVNLPGVQSVDVVGGILVLLLNDESSIAVTRAALAEELGLEKWSAMVGDEHALSLSTGAMLDLIKRTASAVTSTNLRETP